MQSKYTTTCDHQRCSPSVCGRFESDACNRYAASEAVEVLIGEEQKMYSLSKDLLVDVSPYFVTVLKDVWSDGNRNIELKHENPATFEAFINWMYSGATGVGRDIFCYPASKMARHRALYSLASLLMVEKLQNDIIDDINSSVRLSSPFHLIFFQLKSVRLEEPSAGSAT